MTGHVGNLPFDRIDDLVLRREEPASAGTALGPAPGGGPSLAALDRMQLERECSPAPAIEHSTCAGAATTSERGEDLGRIIPGVVDLNAFAPRPRTPSRGAPKIDAPFTSAMLPPDHAIIITIDGPAGTGKSSVARALAKRLGLDFLDTGAMYRAAAAIVLDRGIDPTDHAAVVSMVEKADLHFDWTRDPPQILAFGRPIDHRIREADVTSLVSPIAGIRPLRAHMVAKQRLIGRQHPRLVTEGRDQGSVVFPDAALKFYLDASPDVRARRRAEQLMAEGKSADLGRLTAEIIERDKSDMSRRDGPLIRPADAIDLDTGTLSFEQVVHTLHAYVLERT